MKGYKLIIISIFIILLVITTTGFAYMQDGEIEYKEIDADIIIYNTHNNLKYNFEKEISDISKDFQDRLNQQGVKSFFLSNTYPMKFDPPNAFKNSRKLIRDNVLYYEEKILLDIGRNAENNLPKCDVVIYIGTNHENYYENERFAEKLIKEANNIDDEINCKVVLKNNCIFNQDLSNKALYIAVGNSKTSTQKVNKILYVLTLSLKTLL